jgi:hypothetical protein
MKKLAAKTRQSLLPAGASFKSGVTRLFMEQMMLPDETAIFLGINSALLTMT